MKKSVSLVLCMIVLLVLFMPIALASANDTTLEVSLYGMTMLPSGEWRSEMLSGSFVVYQDGKSVGKLTVNSFGSTKATLPSGSEVTLVPEPGTTTKGFQVEASGYTIAITSGSNNTAHIIAYADSGLFDVYADGVRTFELTSTANDTDQDLFFSEDVITMSFETSSEGIFSLAEPIPSGEYVLTDTQNGKTFEFTVKPYRGNSDDITVIDARENTVVSASATEAHAAAATAEPTAAPTAEPTAEPTAVPTVEPTAEPTATPTAVPTATPTAEPTATPTAVPTATPTAEPTATPTAVPTVTPTAEPTATPTAVPTATPTAEPTATPTAVPTATPTAEPTAVPTATPTVEPTATPTQAPTEAPTATPTMVPTEVPTAEPTAEPQTSTADADNVLNGNLALAFQMPDNAEPLEYIVFQDKEKVVTGTNAESAVKTVNLPDGHYRIQINLPASQYLNSINGTQINRSGKLTWEADLDADLSTYEITIKQLLSLQGSVTNIPDGVKVTVTGGEGKKETRTESGTFSVQGLIPSSYVVSLELPEGEYSGDQWNFTNGYDTVIAQMNLSLSESSVLSTVEGQETQSAAVPSDAEEQTAVNQPEDQQEAENTADESDKEAEHTETADSESEEDLTRYALYSSLLDEAEKQFIPLRELEHKDVNGTATIEVRVFSDSNHNGERGPYEDTLADVEVDLIYKGNEDFIVGSTITGSDGMAIFTDLPAGDYIVRSSLPVYYGYGEKGKYKDNLSSSIMNRQSAQNQESAPIHVDVEQTYHAGIGATKACGFSGQVWLDDGDGIRQESEPGQGGVLVEMIGLHNGLTYQILTGEDGYFNFTQLRYGNYKFKVTLPDGFMFTSASKTGGNNRSVFTSDGKSSAARNIIYDKTSNMSEMNVGVVSEGNIYGTAFKDYNYNGVYDEGDQPLAGVNLTVYRGNSGTDYGTITTGQDGTYIFRALRNNMYRVEAGLPKDDSLFTIVGSGEEANLFSAKGREATVSNIAVGAGESVKVNVGAVYYATITGTAFYDVNFNGVMDADEKMISGLTVNLLAEDGSVADSARTDAKGTYTFAKVFPGTYSIFMKAVDGYAFTRLGENNIIVSKGNGEGSSNPIDVVMGETYPGMDAGLVAPGYVSGVFFGDANDNGIQDAGETGLQNTTVRLINEETAEVYSLNISNEAAYRFDAVLPGTYHAEIDIPENAVYINETNGWTIQGLTARSASFSMNSGDRKELPVLGALTLGSITGTAFDNPLADGNWTNESKGLQGVSISLMTVKGDVYAHVETGADGYFEIRNIRPATYLLSVSIPDGKVVSRKANVTLPIESCKPVQTVPLEFKMGDIYLGQMIGCVLPGTLSGDAWLDENSNGRWDDGERPAVGETIFVYDIETGTNLSTLTTDENGVFANAGMIPGQYRLVYIPDSLTIAAPEGESSFSSFSGQLMTQPIVLQAGSEIVDLHLGLMRYTDIHGTVWFDENGSIEALANAQLTLLDKDGNALQRTASAEDGTYAFTRLLPASYEINVTLPEGHVVVESDDHRLQDGNLRSCMIYVNRRNGSTGQFELKMGDTLEHMDIGSVTPGTLGDFLWLDLNANGLQDSGELGVPNVTVRLLRNDKEIARTVTDQYGFYLFRDLYPSDYILQPELPGEVKPTVYRDDYSGIVSVLGEDGNSVPVSVFSNAANYNADMGAVPVTPGVYPNGYGQGATQNWVK